MIQQNVVVVMPLGGRDPIERRRAILNYKRVEYLVHNKCTITSVDTAGKQNRVVYGVSLVRTTMDPENALEQIENADILIALIVEPNPNVIYEVAYRRALAGTVVLVVNNADNLPLYLQSVARQSWNQAEVLDRIDIIANDSIRELTDFSADIPGDLKRVIDLYDGKLKDGLENALQEIALAPPSKKETHVTKVFVSYARESQGRIRSIAEDLSALGCDVWYDQGMIGGQGWWDQILDEIRQRDVFAFAIAPDSLESVACNAERAYASALNKIILPLLISEGVNVELLPRELARIHYVDCRSDDKESLKALYKALSALPYPYPRLPQPLPQRPDLPLSYLAVLKEQVESTEGLNLDQQLSLLLALKQGLRNAKYANDVLALLRQFRSRDDLLAKVADEIDREKLLER